MSGTYTTFVYIWIYILYFYIITTLVKELLHMLDLGGSLFQKVLIHKVYLSEKKKVKCINQKVWYPKINLVH